MKTRSRAKGLTALLTIALFATTAACSSTSAASDSSSKDLVPLTVGAPWNGAAGKSPTDTTSFGYAVHEGLAQPILEKYGFEYKAFVGFNNGPPVVQALQTGDVQVGLIGDTPAVQAKASGIDVPAS